MKKAMIVAGVVIAVAAALVVGYRMGRAGLSAPVPQPEPAEHRALYHCPMHPQIVSDKPGTCPICGMDLVLGSPERTGGDLASAPATGAREVAGHATLRISAQKRQLIGVRTAPVTAGPFVREIRALGRVAADETRLRKVATKVDGYIERLYANAVGGVVKSGDPLLELYSPEMLANQRELLVALGAKHRSTGEAVGSGPDFADELVRSARKRLQILGLSEDQIERLERTGIPERTITLHSPISGVITARNVTQGQKIASGEALLEVVDLSRVWVLASVYESDLPLIHTGQRATVTLSYLAGKDFEGRVAFVYPTVDPETRTVPVRIELANPASELKPEMFADVVLHADLGERLSVPDSAVLETGTRSIAFVETAEGVFEPRELRIGLRLRDRYEVLDGLEAGERVVVSGNFLIDSESKLKAALAGMETPAETGDAPSGHVH